MWKSLPVPAPNARQRSALDFLRANNNYRPGMPVEMSRPIEQWPLQQAVQTVEQRNLLWDDRTLAGKDKLAQASIPPEYAQTALSYIIPTIDGALTGQGETKSLFFLFLVLNELYTHAIFYPDASIAQETLKAVQTVKAILMQSRAYSSAGQPKTASVNILLNLGLHNQTEPIDNFMSVLGTYRPDIAVVDSTGAGYVFSLLRMFSAAQQGGETFEEKVYEEFVRRRIAFLNLEMPQNIKDLVPVLESYADHSSGSHTEMSILLNEGLDSGYEHYRLTAASYDSTFPIREAAVLGNLDVLLRTLYLQFPNHYNRNNGRLRILLRYGSAHASFYNGIRQHFPDIPVLLDVDSSSLCEFIFGSESLVHDHAEIDIDTYSRRICFLLFNPHGLDPVKARLLSRYLADITINARLVRQMLKEQKWPGKALELMVAKSRELDITTQNIDEFLRFAYQNYPELLSATVTSGAPAAPESANMERAPEESPKIASLPDEQTRLIDAGFGVSATTGYSLKFLQVRFAPVGMTESTFTEILKKLGFELKNGKWFRTHRPG